MKQKLIVGITGASGIQYGLRALELLRPLPVEVHLVVSRAAEQVLKVESGKWKVKSEKTVNFQLPTFNFQFLTSIADVVHEPEDFSAPIASGSFKTMGMLVAPCSVRTLSEIASGVTTTLLSRAADVVLKERRRLVLMVRETPLHLGHLRSMCTVTEMGAIVMPPVPAFYTAPASLDDAITHSVVRALDLLGFDLPAPRWDHL